MADVRIKDLAVTATTTTSDDYLAIDGTTNNTRKVSAYSPTFSGGLNSTPIGASTPSTGAFTTLSATTSALVSNNGDTASANYPSANTRIGGSFDGQLIMTMLSYGANTAIVQGVAGGTKASPTQTTSGSLLMILGGYGYNTTNGWGGGSGTANARITFSATENHTNTAQGAKISFDVTPNTTTSRITAMTLDQSGNVGIGSSSPATLFDVTGGLSTQANPPSSGTTSGGVARIRSYNNSLDIGSTAANILWMQAANATALGVVYPISINPVGGNVLIGTTTDSANGRLQLTSHTTSAGGIGFGADVSLYRSAADVLALASGDALQLGNAYVAGAPTATGYITIKDSTGTTYKIPAVAV